MEDQEYSQEAIWHGLHNCGLWSSFLQSDRGIPPQDQERVDTPNSSYLDFRVPIMHTDDEDEQDGSLVDLGVSNYTEHPAYSQEQEVSFALPKV